jgi:mRNA interferase MazF
MSSRFGDVVLVPFPFTDQTTSSKRAAVVVNSSDYSLHRPDVILMAITSQVRSTPLYGEIVITEWKKAGLVKPSVIKPVVATLHARLILARRGTLSGPDLDALRILLHEILG